MNPRTTSLISGCLDAIEVALRERRHQLTANEARVILNRLSALAEMIDPEINTDDRPVSSLISH